MSRLTDTVNVYASSRGMTEEEFFESAVARGWYDDVTQARIAFYAEDPLVKVIVVARDTLLLTDEEKKHLRSIFLIEAEVGLRGASSTSQLFASALANLASFASLVGVL